MSKAQFKDAVLAESQETEQVEGNVYFPRDSVAMGKLTSSDTQYTCPWKGDAEYFNLELGGETIHDAAWSYPDPKEAARHIAGHLAFDRSKGITIS